MGDGRAQVMGRGNPVSDHSLFQGDSRKGPFQGGVAKAWALLFNPLGHPARIVEMRAGFLASFTAWRFQFFGLHGSRIRAS